MPYNLRSARPADVEPTQEKEEEEVVQEELAAHDETLDVEPPEEEPAPAAAPTLSKNAQKRLAKEAKRAEQKVAWRAKEKEKAKAKKAEKRKLREAEEAAEGGGSGEGQPAKKAKTALKPVQPPPPVPFKARIIIDLGFDDKMSEKEIGSLLAQLGHVHSSNRKTDKPFTDLLMTGLNGRLKQKLDEICDRSYLRWRNVDWWEEGYEFLWEEERVAAPGSEPAIFLERSNLRPWVKEHKAEKGSVVYLTADSENELAELKEGETYIIGGIVDRNRYKNLCKNKAAAQGIRTGKLPIGTYLADMPSRKVLTVNQVFEILVKWVEERNWEKAFIEVVPKRKFKDPNENNPQKKRQNIDDVLDDDDVDGVALVA
ncbi:tRNA (guanine(9)-N(1))-methyltransferase [Tulasnella sp. 427]|nr:tRNA (guanine(9)-N(1))-methyltransferase [Tulasnella sp. 427]